MKYQTSEEKINKLLENIKIAGKVSFSEYYDYLKKKSRVEIKSIYIELLVKKNRIEKMNSLFGYTITVSLFIIIISPWLRFIINSENVLSITNNTTFIPCASIFFLVLILILVVFIFILLNAESNCIRKILIIEEVMKNLEIYREPTQ